MSERSPDPVRQAACSILLRAETQRKSIDAPLRSIAASFEERDRRFLWNLVQETLRWKLRLDAVIAPLLKHPHDRLEPAARVVLRLSAAQFCLMDQVPEHAIGDEAVRLARQFASPGVDRLVNAVTRRLAADGRSRWKRIDQERDPAQWDVQTSHPDWLVRRWRSRHGDEIARAILEWDNQRAPVWLRARPGGLKPDGQPGWVPHTYRMPDEYRPSSDPGFASGEWTVQDPSESLVCLLAPDRVEGPIVDLCAAPGTKTSHLAERYSGFLIATDRTRQRVQRMRETLARTRTAAAILVADARTAALRSGSVGGVLVDAPCSNLGVLRRRPDARWNVAGETDIARRAKTQSDLLRCAAALLRPGGWLLYSVCSTEPEETEGIRTAFLDQDQRFRSEPVAFELPDELVTGEGSIMIRPGQRDCDGVYACLFRRVGN